MNPEAPALVLAPRAEYMEAFAREIMEADHEITRLLLQAYPPKAFTLKRDGTVAPPAYTDISWAECCALCALSEGRAP